MDQTLHIIFWKLLIPLSLFGIFIVKENIATHTLQEDFVNYYNYHEPIDEPPCLKHGSRCNVIHNEATTICCNSHKIYPPCYDFKLIEGQCRWIMCRYPNSQNTYLKYCLHWNYFKYNFMWRGDSHRSGGRGGSQAPPPGFESNSFFKEINPSGLEKQATRHSEIQKQVAEVYKTMQTQAPGNKGMMPSGGHGGDDISDNWELQIAEQLKRIEESL